MKFELDTKLLEKDKLYGTTTVGARGQVVIPVEARKDLKIKSGDQLLVMGKLGKALGLIKVDQLEELISMIMKKIAGTGSERQFRAHINTLFKDVRTNKKSKT